jgi:hypothetical protein
MPPQSPGTLQQQVDRREIRDQEWRRNRDRISAGRSKSSGYLDEAAALGRIAEAAQAGAAVAWVRNTSSAPPAATTATTG